MPSVNNSKEKDLNLFELLNLILQEKFLILKITAGSVFLGLFMALSAQEEYESSCKLLPEIQEASASSLGGLGGLAGLAGIDINKMSSTGILTPHLYPEIVRSLPFVISLMEDSIYFEKIDTTCSPFYYFSELEKASMMSKVKKYTIGLPRTLISMVLNKPKTGVNEKDESYIRYDKSEWEVVKYFSERINVSFDESTGVVSIKALMPDPYAATELANRVKILLTEAVVEYKTNRAQSNLLAVQEAYGNAKDKFEALQLLLARTRDRHRNISSSVGKIELLQIENEHNVAFEVYKGLASKVEQAKITLNEKNPVFTELEPVRVPEDKKFPRRGMIVMASLFIGLFVGAGLVLLKLLIKLN